MNLKIAFAFQIRKERRRRAWAQQRSGWIARTRPEAIETRAASKDKAGGRRDTYREGASAVPCRSSPFSFFEEMALTRIGDEGVTFAVRWWVGRCDGIAKSRARPSGRVESEIVPVDRIGETTTAATSATVDATQIIRLRTFRYDIATHFPSIDC